MSNSGPEDLSSIIDRDKDIDVALGPGSEPAMQPPKRPRLIRNRYPSSQTNAHAIARKLLPIDPSASDKNRRQD